MLIRTFLIKLGVVYDGRQAKEAEKDVADIGKAAAKATRPIRGLDRELDDTTRSAKRAGSSVKRAGREIASAGPKVSFLDRKLAKLGTSFRKELLSSLAKLGPALAAAGVALLLGGVGKAISFVSDETERLDNIAKDSAKTGLGTEQYQLLSQVAKLAGTDVAALGKGTIKLTQNLRDIAAGSVGPASRALSDLGLKVEDLAGKTQTEQLAILADRFGKIENEGVRTALAVDLLGKSGKELIPIFNQGSTAINDAVASVGKIFTPAELAKAEAYQDALAELNKTISVVTGSFAIAAAPALQRFVELAEDAIPPTQAFFEALFNRVAPAFRELARAAAPWVDRLGGDTASLFDGVVGPIGTAADILAFFAKQIAFVLEVGDDLLTWLEEVDATMENEFPRAWGAAGAAVNAIISPLETARTVASEILDFVEGIVDGVGDLGDKVRSVRSAVGLGPSGGLTSASAAATALQAGAATATNNAANRKAAQEADRAARASERESQQAGSNRTAAASLRRRAARAPRRRGRGGGGRSRAEAPDETGNDLLGDLGLTEPGSVMANRPAPQSMTIIIAPVIKMIENMVINVAGGNTPEQRRDLDDAATQARDAVFVKLGDLPALVDQMFRLQAKSLRASSSGRALPGGD